MAAYLWMPTSVTTHGRQTKRVSFTNKKAYVNVYQNRLFSLVNSEKKGRKKFY